MKLEEMRSKTDQELQQELAKSYEDLLRLRFRLATKQLENVTEVNKTRKTIARLKTLMRQREIQGAA